MKKVLTAVAAGGLLLTGGLVAPDAFAGSAPAGQLGTGLAWQACTSTALVEAGARCARLTVPLLAVVLRKAYGLGAMAMTGGDLRAPFLVVAWPTGEFGPMSLEGAVRLGFRREFDALWEEENRLLPVQVTSAIELDESTVRQIGDAIGEQTGRRIELTSEVDPDILGGIVLRVGNSILDASIRNRLEKLRKQVARA